MRPLARAAAAVAVLACLCLFAGASLASASIVKLKPPFEHYMLTYSASYSATDSIVITPNAAEGASTCGAFGSTNQGSEQAHILLSYAFTFGRAREPGGHTVPAFIYKPLAHTITGEGEGTSIETLAAGCPPLPSTIFTPENATCRQAIGTDEPPNFEFDANPASTIFSLNFSLRFAAVGPTTCTGNTDPGSGDAGSDPAPGTEDFGSPEGGPMPNGGSIVFSAAGVAHGHTFHGRVSIIPEHTAANASGNDAAIEGIQLHVWSFNSSPLATLTLAPVAAPHGH